MKIWNNYGSEHSANLVMIGTFKDTISAEKAKEAIERVAEFICNSDDRHESVDRYSDGLLDLLNAVGFHSAEPAEFKQFRLGIYPELKGEKLVITTDEIDVSAYLKLLIDKGARVEVYSAHDYPDTGIGRDTRET